MLSIPRAPWLAFRMRGNPAIKVALKAPGGWAVKVLDLSDRHRKTLTSLNRKKGRQQHGKVLIEGYRAVASAVEGGAPLVEIVVTEKMLAAPKVTSLLVSVEVPVYQTTDREAQRISSVETDQGIFAVVAIQPADVAELYRLHRVLVLDGVQDPGNVGTILRTAAWFGLDAVLGGTGTADFYNPKVVRASMGGLWDVPVARSEALGEDLKTFKSNGFELVGADLDGLTLDQWQPESTGVLVLGNEANGISPEVRLLIDRYVTISGRGKRGGTESLNVATAAGILMHRWMAF